MTGRQRGMPAAGEDRALDALDAASAGQYDEIGVYDGEWYAHREGAPEDDVLTAATAEELDAAIWADMAARGRS